MLQPEGFSVRQKLFQIELYDEESEKVIARSEDFTLNRVIELMNSPEDVVRASDFYVNLNNLVPFDGDHRSKDDYTKTFKFQLIKASRLKRLSIFEFFSKTYMKMVPVFGIDMSDVNLRYCGKEHLHLASKSNPQIYQKFLDQYIKMVECFTTDYCFPYLFGSKLTSESETINAYPFTGNPCEPYVKIEEV